MTYPTEVVAKAKYEIGIFDRPSVDTSKELIAEVEMLRSLVREMRLASMDISTNVVFERETTNEQLIRFAVVIEESKVSVPNKAWS